MPDRDSLVRRLTGAAMCRRPAQRRSPGTLAAAAAWCGLAAVFGPMAVAQVDTRLGPQSATNASAASKAAPQDEDAPPTEAWMTERVVELGHPDLDVRERATRELFNAGVLDPITTARLMRRTSNHEARSRLTHASYRWFVEGPEGALGVEMNRAMRPGGGVVLNRTIPGFDSMRVLRAHDVIIRIDDKPISRESELGNAVRARRPGDLLKIELLRPRVDDEGRMIRVDGETVEDEMTVTVRLGAWEDLPNNRNAPRGRVDATRRRAEWAQVDARVRPRLRVLALPRPEILTPAEGGGS